MYRAQLSTIKPPLERALPDPDPLQLPAADDAVLVARQIAEPAVDLNSPPLAHLTRAVRRALTPHTVLNALFVRHPP